MSRVIVESIELETTLKLLEGTAGRIKEVEDFTKLEREYLRDIIAKANTEELDAYREKIWTLEMVLNSLIRYGKVLDREAHVLRPELREILEKEGKIVEW